MQVMNTSPGTITIAGIHHIPAGELRTFEDDLWATLCKRPAVVQWMKEGKLKEAAPPTDAEIAAFEGKIADAKAAIAGTTIDFVAKTITLTTPDERDPLDHDGDGKKGGSLPKAQRKAKA